MPVDPSVWAGIESQVGVPVADGVNDLFRDRFQGHEMAVDPAVWSGISSQLGHTAVVGTTVGTMLGWAAASSAIVLTGVAGFYWLNEPPGSSQIAVSAPAIEHVEVAEAPDLKETNPASFEVEAALKDFKTSPANVDGLAGSLDPKNGGERVDRPLPPVRMQPLPSIGENDLSPAIDPIDERTREGTARVESIIQELTTKAQMEAKARKEEDREDENGDEFRSGPNSLSLSQTTLPELYIPNTFTPNGDQLNDTYYVVKVPEYETMILRVYSVQNGRLVFSTNSGEPWTGVGCEDGMYMVAVEVVTRDGRTVSEGKVVWLNRSPMN